MTSVAVVVNAEIDRNWCSRSEPVLMHLADLRATRQPSKMREAFQKFERAGEPRVQRFRAQELALPQLPTDAVERSDPRVTSG